MEKTRFSPDFDEVKVDRNSKRIKNNGFYIFSSQIHPVVLMELKFTREHEWIMVEGEIGTIGITDYAQKTLGDVVSVELPDIGDKGLKGKSIAIVDSMKASSEVYCPVSGEVVQVNEALNDNPQLVNQSPYEKGWFIKIQLEDKDELADLLTKEKYEEYVKKLD